MRKALTLLTIIYSLTALTTAVQAQGPSSKPPRVDFMEGIPDSARTDGNLSVSEMKWDFGYISKGAVVQHRYILKNTGTEDLRIVRVKPTCGCTAAPVGKDVLAPGESTELDVTFKSANFMGNVSKYVNIFTDSKLSGTVRVSFSAFIITDDAQIKIQVTPPDVNFVQLYTGEKMEKKVVLENKTNEPLKLKVIEVPPYDFLDVDFKPGTLKPGKTRELKVKLNKNAPAGTFGASITIVAAGEETFRLSIPVRGEIVEKAGL